MNVANVTASPPEYSPRLKPVEGAHSCLKESLEMARSWLRQCQLSHPDCVNRNEEHQPLPFRVLDVGPGNGFQELQLRETNGEKAPYAALSYCWGTEAFLRTTMQTLSSHKINIAFQELPTLFQEALIVTKEMGFRFLWIDSLCIIQDSKEDWEAQSSRMEDYYGNADFVLAATSPCDPSRGLFRDRDPRGLRPCWIPAKFGSKSTVTDLWLRVAPGVARGNLLDWRAHNKNPAPLGSRAWALQERLLARRTLIFSHFQLSFSCLTSVASENSPEGVTHSMARKEDGIQLEDDFEIFQEVIHSQFCSSPQETPGSSRLYNIWYRLVEEYNKRRLTQRTDILPALAGLASRFENVLGDKYLAGLWLGDLWRGLLWSVNPPNITGLPDVPSWSWACVSGTSSSEMHMIYRQTKFANSISEKRRTKSTLIRHLPIHIGDHDVSGQRTFGHAYGQLAVRGILKKAEVSPSGHLVVPNTSNWEWVGNFSPDRGAFWGPLWCLQIVDNDYSGPNRNITAGYFLGLIPAPEGGENTYIRVGLCETYENGMAYFNAIEDREVDFFII